MGLKRIKETSSNPEYIAKIKENMPCQRVFLDRLRVVAIILVIVGHATRMFTVNGVYAGTIPSISFFETATRIIYSFHMPLFFLLSGYVYGICIEKGKIYDSFIPFLKKKALRLLVPYYFWGIAYVAPIMLVLGLTPFSYINFVKNGILLSSDCRHLWFLFVLFLMFAIVQSCRLLIKRNMNPQAEWGGVLIISIFLATILRYAPIIHSIPFLQISSLCTYLMYFLIGLGFYKNKTAKKYGVCLKFICLLSLFFGLGLDGSVSLIVVLILCLFIPFEKIIVFTALMKNALGIYILHPIMLYVIFYFYNSSFNPYLFCVLAIAVVTELSYICCGILHKFKFDILLGE